MDGISTGCKGRSVTRWLVVRVRVARIAPNCLRASFLGHATAKEQSVALAIGRSSEDRVSSRVNSIINDCKRTRRDEGLFKRIIFTRNRRHYERGDGCGTRLAAGPHQFDTRAVHCGDHPSHCEGWRKRPSYFAADGAVGAADCAARLTYTSAILIRKSQRFASKNKSRETLAS